MAENGDTEGSSRLISDRLKDIEKLKGDPSGTQMLQGMVNEGRFEELAAKLKPVEQIGIKDGHLVDPLDRQIKEAKLAKARGGSAGPKLGTYNPSDYTIKTWAEFAKNGDPAILERYQGQLKERKIEIQEQVLDLKVEKQAIAKQKAETEKNQTEIKTALKKKDIDRAKFLEVEEAKNALSNIDTLLNSDLDTIYGSMEFVLPDMLRSQKGKNMLAIRNQVGSTLSLMAAGKLKGQGTITDPERQMLAEAASILKNQDISADQARAELIRIKPTFEYVMTGARSEEDSAEQTPRSRLDELRAKAGF
jgi:hypothetical protein